MARAPAQIDRGAIGLERGVDVALLQLDVRNRRQVKRTLDRQQVDAGNLVAFDQAFERPIEIADAR